MTIYSFHLFDRNCDPAITHHFHPPAHDLPALDLAKLIFGITYSLRSSVRKLTPSGGGGGMGGEDTAADDGTMSFRTSGYGLHALESPSLLRFILITSPTYDSLAAHRVLRQIYAGLYVEYILKNPLSLACLYDAGSVKTLRDARFGVEAGNTKQQGRRRREILLREAGGVDVSLESSSSTAPMVDTIATTQVGTTGTTDTVGKGETTETSRPWGGGGVGRDVSMVMGCELFLLALDQFVGGLPGYQ